MQRDGFTFIEILITMGILLMLTSVLLLYNRSGERQIILFKEKASVVGLILKAKSLSLNTLITNEPICGYGVHFETNSYLLFKERSTDCINSDRIYTVADSQELVEEYTLSSGLKFSPTGFQNILFMPPDPFVFFDGVFASGERLMTISNIDGSASVNLKINSSGQISQ
ncbi:MAG: prepilin-type N-terminal cleavage/methylation domain-containing protein [Patescibacteria group bacterium]